MAPNLPHSAGWNREAGELLSAWCTGQTDLNLEHRRNQKHYTLSQIIIILIITSPTVSTNDNFDTNKSNMDSPTHREWPSVSSCLLLSGWCVTQCNATCHLDKDDTAPLSAHTSHGGLYWWSPVTAVTLLCAYCYQLSYLCCFSSLLRVVVRIKCYSNIRLKIKGHCIWTQDKALHLNSGLNPLSGLLYTMLRKSLNILTP